MNNIKIKNIGQYRSFELYDKFFESGEIQDVRTYKVDKNGDLAFAIYSLNLGQEEIEKIDSLLKARKEKELIEWLEKNEKEFNISINPNYKSAIMEPYNKPTPSVYSEKPKKQYSDKGFVANDRASEGKNESGGYQNSYKQLPIFALIMSLQKNNYISLVGDLEKNGVETKYRFEINPDISTRVIKDSFIVSTVGENNYEKHADRANYYVDFKGYFLKEKGSAGEMNFMRDLERLGAFGTPVNPDDFSNRDQYEGKLKEKIRPLLNQLRKSAFDIQGDDFIIKKSSGFSRTMNRPQTMFKPVPFNVKTKQISDIVKILKSRGFSDKIINDSVSKNVLRFGKSVNPKLGFQSVIMSANMHNVFDPKFPIGYEIFTPKEGAKFNKFFSAMKRTQPYSKNETTGTSYALSVDMSEKPLGTVFSEAVLDSIAVKDIMDYCGVNYDNFNHIAAQGVGNMVNFFKDNFGFYYKTMDDPASGEYKMGDIYIVEKKKEIREIDEGELKRLQDTLKDLKIKFIFDESKKGSSSQLFKLKSFMQDMCIKDNIEVIKIPYSTSNPNIKIDKEDDIYIMDNSNVNKFFDENSISVEYDKEKKLYKYGLVVETEEDRKFDPEKDSYKELADRLFSVLKSKTFYLAFDNDIAGLKHYAPIQKMCEKLNFRCRALCPPFHMYKEDEGSRLINDNNDVLMFIRHLDSMGRFSKKEIKDWVIDSFLIDMKQDRVIENIDSIIERAQKIEEVQKNKTMTQEERIGLLKEMTKRKPPTKITSLSPN